MARNVYGGYCRECGRWTPPGFGHFERYRGGWRVHCVECASGRKLPPEGDQAAQDMRRHVRNMVNDGRYGKGGYSNGREVKMNLLLNLAEAMGEDPRDVVRKKVER